MIGGLIVLALRAAWPIFAAALLAVMFARVAWAIVT
jgi:hypothetical protein